MTTANRKNRMNIILNLFAKWNFFFENQWIEKTIIKNLYNHKPNSFVKYWYLKPNIRIENSLKQ